MRSHVTVASSLLVMAGPVMASRIPESLAQPTYVAVASNHLVGISPRITAAPVADPRSLVGRANAFDRNPDTCGFYSDGYPLLCYASDATCVYGSSFAGCCNEGSSCSSIFTSCVGYSDVLKGSCDPDKLTDPQVACCPDRTAPNCVLHSLSISSRDVGIWGCATTEDGETILTTNPFPPDSSSSTTTSSSSTTTSASSSATATNTTTTAGNDNKDDEANDDKGGEKDGGKKKSNTGAIAGGVVGGVAGLALIGAAIFFLLRRNKKKDEMSPAPVAAPPMGQYPNQSPPQGQAAPYMYSSVQGTPNYDPSMAYQHQQGSPQPYPPSSQSPYNQYQQSSWGHPSTTASSPAPVGTSPGPMGAVEAPTGTSPAMAHSSPAQSNAHAVEAPSNDAIGTTGNRAELG